MRGWTTISMLLNDIEKSSSGGLLYQLHIKKIFCDVSIISHQKYVKYTDGEMEIYCMSSEYSKFSDHVKTHEITQLALIIQKESLRVFLFWLIVRKSL